MGQNSKIEWTHHTFNPWVGCTKVSAGCKNCYAEQLMDKRYGRVQWGVHGTRSKTSAANWKQPLRWDRAAAKAGVRHRVFCASLADVFEDRQELVEWRAELFALIDATPHLDWLLLTKRPENIWKMWPGAATVKVDRYAMARMNVWLGTSVEDQAAADERIPQLLKAWGLCRFTFLSCEPLLGKVRLTMPVADGHAYRNALSGRQQNGPIDGFFALEHLPRINWVIAGGESGKDARPMHPDWVRSLRDQCKAAGVAFLFKQWGEWKPLSTIDGKQQVPFGYYVLPNADGTGGFGFTKVGKHAAGRLLDGVEHNGVPGEVVGGHGGHGRGDAAPVRDGGMATTTTRVR